MLDPRTGRITDHGHELFGKSLKGAVLVFPHAVGSSVGAYTIYSLRENGNAPGAMICSKTDITTASGCAISRIPVVDLPRGTDVSSISEGMIAVVDAKNKSAVVTI
jgi:predicted aconitase with swiveling domain